MQHNETGAEMPLSFSFIPEEALVQGQTYLVRMNGLDGKKFISASYTGNGWFKFPLVEDDGFEFSVSGDAYTLKEIGS